MYLVNLGLFTRRNLIKFSLAGFSSKPTSAEVLTAYLSQCNEPPWTSYFVKYSSVKDNQFGMSNFNWKVGKSNYQILRTGCYPYIKYHCSRKHAENLDASDKFMRFIKIVNLGIPCLLYGLAATQLIRHSEIVHTSKGSVIIYFLLPEDKGRNNHNYCLQKTSKAQISIREFSRCDFVLGECRRCGLSTTAISDRSFLGSNSAQ